MRTINCGSAPSLEGASFDTNTYQVVADAFTRAGGLVPSSDSLSADEKQEFIELIIQRMKAGRLNHYDLYAFANNIALRGIPLPEFRRNPLVDLDLCCLEPIDNGCWLPDYMRERRISEAQFEDELNPQHKRIIGVIQQTLNGEKIDIPMFFIGSAASLRSGLPRDIDIGTSLELRRAYLDTYDQAFNALRKNIQVGEIIGDKNHVGAVWSPFLLCLGVSIHRYSRAFRVTASDVYIIEASRKSE